MLVRFCLLSCLDAADRQTTTFLELIRQIKVISSLHYWGAVRGSAEIGQLSLFDSTFLGWVIRSLTAYTHVCHREDNSIDE